MKEHPLRTTVIGSYPFPGWLEFACQNLDKFGEADREELIDDAVVAAVYDQLEAGLDVITDGEQTRLDFNLSFYGFLDGIELESAPPRRFGPPAHDQRGRHKVVGELRAPRGLGAVRDFERLQRLAAPILPAAGHHPSTRLKASVPGPYTLSGRLIPNQRYRDRYALTEALLPIVRDELMELVRAGCEEICVDEPSMSCYAHREDPEQFVDIFNRTVDPIFRRCRLSTHLCFGNFKGHAVGPRRYAPMFPAFHNLLVDEVHLEMASREFAELEIISEIAKKKDVAVGIIDVKSYYVETVEDVAERVRLCMKHAPAERLAFAPDCGLSQTARWAAKQKLKNMVEGVKKVRKELGVDQSTTIGKGGVRV
jgi:5-methyltetrahydropteroyltriglutamate--homocysteine methyltransferase